MDRLYGADLVISVRGKGIGHENHSICFPFAMCGRGGQVMRRLSGGILQVEELVYGGGQRECGPKRSCRHWASA